MPRETFMALTELFTSHVGRADVENTNRRGVSLSPRVGAIRRQHALQSAVCLWQTPEAAGLLHRRWPVGVTWARLDCESPSRNACQHSVLF